MDEHVEPPVTAAEPALSSGSQAVAPLLRRNHQQGRSEAFFALLEPVMRRHTGYLCHALHTLESDDGLPSEDVAPDDVLNEALARAWDHFGTCPQDRPLDQWLREVVEGVLRQTNHHLAQRSLDEEVAEPADDSDDPLRDAWTEAGGYQQTVELAELVAGHPGVDAWDRLNADADKSGLVALLGKLPRDQRQALVLSLTEGFSAAEIADFQGRSTSDVEEDIRLAEQALRREVDGTTFDALQSQLTAARHKTRGRR